MFFLLLFIYLVLSFLQDASGDKNDRMIDRIYKYNPILRNTPHPMKAPLLPLPYGQILSSSKSVKLLAIHHMWFWMTGFMICSHTVWQYNQQHTGSRTGCMIITNSNACASLKASSVVILKKPIESILWEFPLHHVIVWWPCIWLDYNVFFAHYSILKKTYINYKQ